MIGFRKLLFLSSWATPLDTLTTYAYISKSSKSVIDAGPPSSCLILFKSSVSCFPRPWLPKDNKSLRFDNKISQEFTPITLSNIS